SQITSEEQAVIDSLNQTHNTLLGALIAMIVVAIASAAEVTSGVWIGMFRPLKRLARSARAVADGRSHQAIPAAGPPEIAGLSRDVELMRTRLVAALAERERAEQNLRSLFEMAPDAMLGVAPGGLIVTANAQAARTFGYPGHELIGRQAATLVPEDRRAALTTDAESYFGDERSRAHWDTATASGLRGDG